MPPPNPTPPTVPTPIPLPTESDRARSLKEDWRVCQQHCSLLPDYSVAEPVSDRPDPIEGEEYQLQHLGRIAYERWPSALRLLAEARERIGELEEDLKAVSEDRARLHEAWQQEMDEPGSTTMERM